MFDNPIVQFLCRVIVIFAGLAGFLIGGVLAGYAIHLLT